MEQFSFEKLESYKEAVKLVKQVYLLTEKFPNHEKYGLYSQAHRAITSVPLNIAEQCGRRSYKDKIHFLEIAFGSLLETYCQLNVAIEIGYITPEDLQSVKSQFFTVSRLINALSRSYQSKLDEKPHKL